MSDSPNYMAQAEAIFRRMLSRGRPVAFEDAARCVATPEGVDRRCFGHIPARLRRDGLIVQSGFRVSESPKHNCGVKRLWVLVDAVKEGQAMSDSPNFTAQSVGWFEVPSGRLVVADPVYLTHPDLAAVIDNAKPGRWVAMVGHARTDCGPRVSSLFVFHESGSVRDARDDRELSHTIGVDTGRVCVIDSGAIGSYEDADLSPGYKPGPFGVMARSGFGDGIYPCRVCEYAGQAVSVRVTFIEPEVIQ